MSTNSNIRIYRKDGTRTGVYCHSDGYPEYVGTMLQLFYNTSEKVEELLKDGDMSTMGCSPNECVYYTKWRNEQLRHSLQDEEFNYIFLEYLGVWVVQTSDRWCYYDNSILDVELGYNSEKKEDLLINVLEKRNKIKDEVFGYFDKYFSESVPKVIETKEDLTKLLYEKAIEGRKESEKHKSED